MEGFAEDIKVDMDGVWGTACVPDWLTTMGVDTCIAVAVADDAAQQAWLIHSPALGHQTEPLEDMLNAATANRPGGAGLKVWVFGGAAADADCEVDAALARDTVEALLTKSLLNAMVKYQWEEGGDVELLFENGAWDCTLS